MCMHKIIIKQLLYLLTAQRYFEFGIMPPDVRCDKQCAHMRSSRFITVVSFLFHKVPRLTFLGYYENDCKSKKLPVLKW